jgi:hypothetical protein
MGAWLYSIRQNNCISGLGVTACKADVVSPGGSLALIARVAERRCRMAPDPRHGNWRGRSVWT